MPVKRLLLTLTVLLTLLLPIFAQAQQPVSIPDAHLAAAIQQKIGNEITTDTILNLTQLHTYTRKITDLTGLEHAKNLRVLVLQQHGISDISALSGLTKLRSVVLSDNSISDISALSGLTKLTQLFLDRNNISDVSGLVELRELTSLGLQGNPLNAAAINTHIPAIQANGTQVKFDAPVPTTPQPPPTVAPTPQTTAASLTATPSFLTEATLGESRVTLTLHGRLFKNDVNKIRGSVSASGIPSLILPADGFTRNSDTQITIRLFFNGDLDRNGTLTLRVSQAGIQTHIDADLIAEIPVSAVEESLTATPSGLTEATLHGSRVTLTLYGRKFANNIEQYVATFGIPSLRLGNIVRVSDTVITVPLEFHGDLTSDATLTFWINQGGIPHYSQVLTTEIPVSAGTAPVKAPQVSTNQPPNLVVSAIRSSKTTLTPGEQFTLFATVKNRGTGQSPATPLAFQGSTTQIGTRNVNALSANRSVEVNLPLAAPAQEGVYHYRAYLQITNKHSEWVSITVAAPATTPQVPTPQSTVAPTPQPPVEPTPQPTVAPTPQPTVVSIPDANLRTAIQQEIGNTLTTQTLLNLTRLDARALGITNLTGLEYARNLRMLLLSQNSISDISALSGMTQLLQLVLSQNSISDISALSGMTQLDHLFLHNNNISDISTLAGLTQLTRLTLTGNPLNAAAITTHIPAIQANGTDVSFDNRSPATPQPTVPPTPQPTPTVSGPPSRITISGSATRRGATVNQQLDTPLLVRVLDVVGTGVADVRVLFNVISGRGKVSERGNGRAIRVQTDRSGYARADFTPLADGTIRVQASATGISQTVEFTIMTGAASTPQPPVEPTPQSTVVRIPDANLRTAVQQEIGNTLTTNTMLNLTTLEVYDLGIRHLAGLEHAKNLSELSLRSNSISDTSPLAGLTRLTDLDLYDNNISDIAPLVGLTQLKHLDLRSNPLHDVVRNTHIPAIQTNGTQVEFDDRAPTTSPPPSVVSTPQPNVVTTAGSHPPMYWVSDSFNTGVC